MKKNLLFILILLISSKLTAQSCTDIEEMYRKRHKIDGMTYGHPYTIFDRHNGLSLDSMISNICLWLVFSPTFFTAFNYDYLVKIPIISNLRILGISFMLS